MLNAVMLNVIVLSVVAPVQASLSPHIFESSGRAYIILLDNSQF
jgi:hypothetical protein